MVDSMIQQLIAPFVKLEIHELITGIILLIIVEIFIFYIFKKTKKTTIFSSSADIPSPSVKENMEIRKEPQINDKTSNIVKELTSRINEMQLTVQRVQQSQNVQSKERDNTLNVGGIEIKKELDSKVREVQAKLDSLTLNLQTTVSNINQKIELLQKQLQEGTGRNDYLEVKEKLNEIVSVLRNIGV